MNRRDNMLQKGDMVVYKCRGMFQIQDVGRLNFSYIDRKKQYYTLHSVEDEKETVYVPVEDQHAIRLPMNKEEAQELLEHIEETEILWIPNEKLREQEYRRCVGTLEPKEWVRILKTLYLRTKKRGSITSMDKKYQQVAERALYSELAHALEIPKNQVENVLWYNK